MDGVEYLYNTDCMEIFFSKTCEKISRKNMDYILKSGCGFQIYKLRKTGKNALDFYIVSRIGEMLGTGCNGKIVAVSRDKGYSAIKDYYWMTRGLPKDRILLSHSVKTGIVSSNENSVRKKQIIGESEQISIESEYARYAERQRMNNKLKILFRDTEYDNEIAQICELAETEKKPRDLYLGSLKRFGREDGTKIYRYLKRSFLA
ncbi:MAG: PIN domain-containing protein [Clostridiales bacterium]|nr:PIN domain-containing protein [Clostridiales bacterium]